MRKSLLGSGSSFLIFSISGTLWAGPIRYGEVRLIKSASKNECVRVNDNANRSSIVQDPCYPDDFQRWKLADDGYGQNYQIENLATGKCIDVSKSSHSDGTPILQYSCYGSANQSFELRALGNSTFQIIAYHSGKCLALDAYARNFLVQETCRSGVPEQRWVLEDENQPVVPTKPVNPVPPVVPTKPPTPVTPVKPPPKKPITPIPPAHPKQPATINPEPTVPKKTDDNTSLVTPDDPNSPLGWSTDGVP